MGDRVVLYIRNASLSACGGHFLLTLQTSIWSVFILKSTDIFHIFYKLPNLYTQPADIIKSHVREKGR